MKTLLLLRHAKSSKDDPSLPDFDRPLNNRGKEDSRLIGSFIGKKKVCPDLIISSPAKRARQTTELVLKAAVLNTDPFFDERIYEASPPTLLRVVSEIKDSANTAMLVGHNPGFEDLLRLLVSQVQDLPTASVACVELELEKWSSAHSGVGSLKWLVTPKQLRQD